MRAAMIQPSRIVGILLSVAERPRDERREQNRPVTTLCAERLTRRTISVMRLSRATRATAVWDGDCVAHSPLEMGFRDRWSQAQCVSVY